MIIEAERLAEVFVEFADTLVDDFDVVEFLQMVTTRGSQLTGSAAAGLLLADHRRHLRFMAASEEHATLLEVFQVQAQEGPCQDAYSRGTTVINADLTRPGSRWPGFAAKAVSLGYHSVHAFPLRLRTEVIGAMGLFGGHSGGLTPADVAIVQALADVATIGLLQARAVRRGEVLTEQLQAALASRVLIEQAKGTLAQLRGGSVDEAFAVMRAYCRSNHRRLGDVAAVVVDDPTSIPALTAH